MFQNLIRRKSTAGATVGYRTVGRLFHAAVLNVTAWCTTDARGGNLIHHVRIVFCVSRSLRCLCSFSALRETVLIHGICAIRPVDIFFNCIWQMRFSSAPSVRERLQAFSGSSHFPLAFLAQFSMLLSGQSLLFRTRRIPNGGTGLHNIFGFILDIDEKAERFVKFAHLLFNLTLACTHGVGGTIYHDFWKKVWTLSVWTLPIWSLIRCRVHSAPWYRWSFALSVTVG